MPAFLAIGADVGKHVDIPARDAVRVLDAVSLLHDVQTGEAPLLGRRVIVYGGGNTAMDAARTVRRLGADEALIVYRRDRVPYAGARLRGRRGHRRRHQDQMAHHHQGDRRTTAYRRDRWTLDADGRPQPTGQFETLPADAVVLALGQTTDSDFLRNVPGLTFGADGTVVVGTNMMTGHPGLFAGGDAIAGERSVTIAVGHGKRAARNIDAWLRETQLRGARPKRRL